MSEGPIEPRMQVCLELMISLALRNRDRITLIWPQLHAHLATIMGNDVAKSANAIVERATVGLLRVCQRLLTYHQAAAPDLMRSLVLILRLHPEVAWALRDKIASEVCVRNAIPVSHLAFRGANDTSAWDL